MIVNLSRWLEDLGLAQYAEQFRSNEIDAELLPRLSSDDLKEIGVAALGHRKKLLEAIRALAAAADASSPTPVRPALGDAPERFTPGHLAERILRSKAALEGERKQVTVLFADLKGSMELLADRDPEEARKLLDPVLEHMMEAVHRYEGTVNQVMGDGIMALFGAPLAHEDHAVRACYAALRMQETRQALRGRRRAARTAWRCRSASASTPARSWCARSAATCAWTTPRSGQTTHLAARMEQLAPPGTRPADRRDPAAGRGLRRGQVARAQSR